MFLRCPPLHVVNNIGICVRRGPKNTILRSRDASRRSNLSSDKKSYRPPAGGTSAAQGEVSHPSDSPTALVKVQKAVPFGQSLRVVGSHPLLGEWDPSNGLALEWSEGDIWSADVALPPGTWEFKVVVVGGAEPVWEDGENRQLEVPEDALGALKVTCDWGATDLTFTEEGADEGAVRDPQRDATADREPLGEPADEADAAEAADRTEGTSGGASAGNAEAAREWIASWRARTEAGSPCSSGDGSAEWEGTDSPPGDQLDGSDAARQWISAWRTRSVAGSAGEMAGGASRAAPATEAPLPPPDKPQSAPTAARAGAELESPGEELPAEGTVAAGGVAGAAALAGLLAAPVVAWSELALLATGCGLPPGPSGLLGAAEGVSYLTVGGILAWSLASKASTGKGLPPGPGGLLGAAEGLAYLVALSGVGVLSYQLLERGYVPGALPDETCFGAGSGRNVDPLDADALRQSLEPIFGSAVEQAGREAQALADSAQQQYRSWVESLPSKESIQGAIRAAQEGAGLTN